MAVRSVLPLVDPALRFRPTLTLVAQGGVKKHSCAFSSRPSLKTSVPKIWTDPSTTLERFFLFAFKVLLKQKTVSI